MKIQKLNSNVIFIIIIILLIILFFVYFKSLFKKTNVNEEFTTKVEQTGAEVSTLSDGKTQCIYKNSGSLTVAYGASIRILLVGGGGGGGHDGGGGGGGGGIIEKTADIKAGTYQITIGNGGAGTKWRGINAKNGGNTSFGDLFVAIGGGGGGNNHGRTDGANNDNVNGGSGGGQGATSRNDWTGPGKGTSGQGYDGGTSSYSSGGGGGGGGGKGNGMNGGIGFKSNITGTDVYYGGGGGAGSWETTTQGPGGQGGGGKGGGNWNSSNTNGENATFYGGGGGGSGYITVNGNISGNGYQGIVIIIVSVNPPPPLPPNYTADFNIYSVVDHNPVILQPQNRLSCISNDCKTNNQCMMIKMGKNMAISFQTTLNKPNGSNNWQQILGLTSDPCGSDKRIFGAFLGGDSKSGISIDTSINNGDTTTDYSFKNLKDLSDFQATMGKNMRVDILCNYNQQKHETYVNGTLIDTKTFYENAFFTTGNAYVFTSFSEFSNADGNLHDVVVLTSDNRTFKLEDLTNATTHIDTSLRNSASEQSMQPTTSSPGKEGFTGSYVPLDDSSYSLKDIRSMESEILQQINDFNQGYSNYIKYLYNQRHNQTGDTATKFTLTDNSGNAITDADFSKNMHTYSNMNESETYKNLVKDLQVFNEALKYNAQVDLSYSGNVPSIESMEKTRNELANIRTNLDQQLAELNETEGTLYMQNYNDGRGQTLKVILLTTLATSLVYYTFMHAS